MLCCVELCCNPLCALKKINMQFSVTFPIFLLVPVGRVCLIIKVFFSPLGLRGLMYKKKEGFNFV